MALFSLRSLLLAAILLSNCLAWTPTRHHHPHNLSRHRTRHRRQGAGLYLPASYVLPGGEGSGAWGEWGEVSQCSRTCGGGVASQKRICLEVSPDGQPLCTGGDTKYFSCQTQDCPVDSGDFRSQQCSEYDDVAFRGIKYEWIPYTNAPNPCELNCMPRGERFYYRQQAKVIDGTRCNDESFNVCVNGTCQPVGCDMMLGSNAREDKCRECRGNGTNCYTVTGLIDTKDLRKGYNDVLLIPQGATSIMIAEIRSSNNYLALRAKEDNVYYLNGEYHIDFPRSLTIAGTLWHYERSQQGFAAPDKLRCLGPTTEPLYLSLLLQDENVGIEYEYSVPLSMAPPPNQQYNWVHGDFSQCSATCGGGFQTRQVTCRSREELEIVDDTLCDVALKPATNQSCNTEPCPAHWVEGPWSPCSKACGKGGTRSRQVYCEKIIANRFPSIVADKECFDLLGPKPELYQECNQNASCPSWFTEPWKPCDKLCGEGKQTRKVVCHQKIDGKVEVFEDQECGDEKPPTEQACMLHPCVGIDWVLSDWSGCDTCTSTVRTRVSVCVTKDHKVVNSSFCSYHPAPVLEEPCDRTKLPTCDVMWYATQWSKCSVQCGKGIQSRRVFCGFFDGASVIKVDDERCDKSTKYKDTKPCEVTAESCAAKWYAEPWSECTKQCGGGEQHRGVMCLSGGVEVGTCPEESIPETMQTCNTAPCDKTITSTTVSTIDEDYDYEECIEYDDNPEVGAEEFIPLTGSTIDDMMLSDSPFTDEGSGMIESTLFSDTESEFKLESGSGSETSITSSWATEESGSGSSSTDVTDETTEFSSMTDNTESSTDETESELTEEFITMKSTKLLDSGLSTSEATSKTDLTTESSSTSSDSSTISLEISSTEIPTGSTETAETESKITGDIIESSTTTDVSETASEVTFETSSTESSTSSEIEIIGSSKESSTTSVTESDSTSSTESTIIEDTETTGTGLSSSTSETEETETTETGSTDITMESTSSSETESTLEETGTTESTEFTTTETSESSSSTDESSVSDITETSMPSSSEFASESSLSTTESELLETSESGSGYTTELTTELTTEEDIISTTESGTTELSSKETTELNTSISPKSESSITTDSLETMESVVSTTAESTDKENTESSTSASLENSTTEVLENTSLSTPETSESEATDTTLSATTEEAISSTESGSSTELTEEPTTSSGSTFESEESSTAAISSIESSSTQESSVSITSESTESTVEGLSTTEISATEATEARGGSTPWDWASTVEGYKTQSRCKARRKIAKCLKSKFGCCPDKKTPAAGPFDKGCPNIGDPDKSSCKDSKFGCCPDGVSPARGHNNRGCPTPPCKETLYGCCLSDNVTIAEGNEQEGCPPMPSPCKSSRYGCCADETTEAKGPEKKGCPETVPKKEEPGCAVSEFGCCADNKTEATGLHEKGCPCNTTKFGCCPDGVSAAQGSQMEGCVRTCNSSAYGCCPDGETPAHGPDYEGCCLQYRFGCCPDNYKQAEGPRLEGCGCEHSHFGCCPDNITIARGPANEGCGCQFSEFGCCPDKHTEAAGPDFEGCDCHTYQFGCCPDGATVAAGPNLQGCLCQHTQYGCCGDGVTAAVGPDRLGCDCASSKYGCCPDGRTEAQGVKFLGCVDAPENRQAACSLSTDRGPCRNYSVYWYYDMEYGGCSRFWYGGCEGNGNRFTSKEECEDVCVQPSPKEACKLPKVKGACLGYHLRWYYDAARELCGQFVFGGCLGNANNFDSRDLCRAQCEPPRPEDQCQLPIEQGPCAGNFGRWGFNAESRRCDQFVWGGCEGNANRFSSEAACMERCNPPGTPQPECALQQETGNCTEKFAVWSFSQTENRCVPFYYTGCGGNGNRFESKESCMASCPSAYVQDICTLPALTGDCADYRERWYYDTLEKRCRQFYFGGCGGNDNNFESQQECEGRCSETPVTTTTVQPAGPDSYRSEFCFLELDPGPCNQLEARWGYDSSLGACTTFQYGGCGGNRNNFPSREYCQYYCATVQDICQLPMRAGPCDESLMRWFYNSVTDSCSQFTYGGCEGNDNRFESLEACEQRCRTGGAEPSTSTTSTTSTTTIATTTTTAAVMEAIPQNCQVSPILEECSGAGIVWYWDTSRRECASHENVAAGAAGAACRRSGVFGSQEACERSCGAFRSIDVCRYPVDPGPCRSFQPKFYFDAAASSCQQYMYGGCHGGPNRFSTLEECMQVCRPETDPCKQRPEPGNCLAYLLMWYYDDASDTCNQFVYGGCNGNDNRFETREDCEGRCRKYPTPTTSSTVTTPITESTPATVSTTTTTTTTTITVAPITTQETPVEEECRTPSLEPCGGNVTAFYYDTSRSACLPADIGGCGRPNAYRTEEECERRCGAFRGLDVCGSRLDPGPCKETGIMKVYWDAETGRCLPFAYGGCLGGPNRFSTVDECEEVCGPTGPVSNEVLPDCTRYNEECDALRCSYGVQRTRTTGGCERCACVQLEVDCEPLRRDCERLKCTYGILKSTGDDGCERCRCLDHPCANKECALGERCVATAFRDPVLQEISYVAGCNIVNKTGSCPSVEEMPAVEGTCRRECNDDADCRGVGKCCERGCSQLCLEPAATAATATSPAPAPHTASYVPELPQAPQANTDTEPEVTAEEGGKATLRCFFHGNPPPTITWRRGEITIDGASDRYQLLSDGALEIVSLYRNDSGVYICIGDNGLGTARQEIRLIVSDPVESPAGIAAETNAVVTGELGRVLNLRCMAYGFPQPSIFWYRGLSGPMVPYSSTLYEARGNVLQIRRLDLDTLGDYACQAYNGIGKPASWSVVVKAYRPEGEESESPYLVERHEAVLITPREPPTETTTTRTTEIEVPVYTVPVTTRILATQTTIAAGAELSLPCEVDGYPEPDIYWTKDGVPLSSNDRMQITEARLLITSVNINDSGVYGCHARNRFSSHSSTLQINVQGLYIPPRCTDNPFFANCHLIVRSKFCTHKYYSKFCCKSCVEAGLLDPQDLGMLADESWKKK